MSDDHTQPAAEEGEETLDRTIEEHAAKAGTPAWALECTKTFYRWGMHQRMSRANYDDAVKTAINHPAG